MPLYRCTSAPDALDDVQRAAVAKAITAIHCSLTGAPPTFVHVQFHHAETFRRSRSGADVRFELHGGIRAGRSPELAEQLVLRCRQAVSAITGAPLDSVTMRTSATPASWILEGGRVLPEPGEEAAWLAEHR